MSGTGGAAAARLPKRFYKAVTVERTEAGWGVVLDGKPVRTPGKRELAAPVRALAEAIAGEWHAQGERIDPASMPLTRFANTALDGVAGNEKAVAGDIAAYAASDLVCYRAEGPEGLVALQRAHWDPVLAWAATGLGAKFTVTEGIVPREQPEKSLKTVRAALARYDAFALAALHVIATLTGSALLALAHADGLLTADEVWTAAHVDEDWQISQWGEDAEAAARRAARRIELDVAARTLALLGA